MNGASKFTLAAIAALCSTVFGVARADVYCDGVDDRTDIQNAIDAATEGDVISLHGHCVLDGQRLVIHRSHLTLRGDSSDTDGDGFTDQWNTVLEGNGQDTDLLDGPYDNMGLHIGRVPATDENIVGVRIQGLELRNFYQALTVAPGAFAEDNLHCDALQVTPAKAVQTHIVNNRFVNNANHFFLYGGAENTVFEGNQLEGGGGIPLASATFALSKRSICLDDPASGATSSLSIGISDNLKVIGNRFYGVGATTSTGDLELVNATNSRIEGNEFTGDYLPLFLFGAINTRVRDNLFVDSLLDAIELINARENQVSKNTIAGAGSSGVLTFSIPAGVPVVEVLALPQSDDNQISCNTIVETNDVALLVIDSGNQVNRNRFSGNPLDVLLLAPGNDVVVGPNDSWVDATGANDVAVTGKESRCAPEWD